MKFEAIIDLVKYTLAITAACFVYALEKLLPAPSELGRWLLLGLLTLFIISALAGIFIFSSTTAALHGDKDKAARQQRRIERAAYIHIGLLGLGVLFLGGKPVERVLTEVPRPSVVCCSSVPTKP
jgi:hypothetical protein